MDKKHKFTIYQRCIITAITAHIIMLSGTFISIKLPVFYIQNICALFFYSILAISRKYFEKTDNILKTVFLVVLVGWIQVFVSFICVGWDGGFQNYLFTTITIAFLYGVKGRKTFRSRIPSLITIGSIILFVIMMFMGYFSKPLYEIDKKFLFDILFLNSIFNFTILIIFFEIYASKFGHDMDQLRTRAEHDELTNLLNRHSIRKNFDYVKKESIIHKTKYSITVFDIDDFKGINDTYGHNKGDEVLVAIGKELQAIENETLSCCRWGGEEFLIIHQYGSDKTKSIKMVNDLKKKIASLSFESNGNKFTVTITAGIAFSHKGLPIHEQIDKADRRLYWGKRHGKNQTVFDDL